MVYLIATLDVPAEHRNAFIASVQDLVVESARESGCLTHDCLESTTQPNRFVFLERWETREALDAHPAQAHVQAWRAKFRTFGAAPSQVEIITPAEVQRR